MRGLPLKEGERFGMSTTTRGTARNKGEEEREKEQSRGIAN